MNRREFFGFLGGTIGGVAVGRKAFAESLSGLLELPPDPTVSEYGRDYQRFAWAMLRELDRRMLTKERYTDDQSQSQSMVGTTWLMRRPAEFYTAGMWERDGMEPVSITERTLPVAIDRQVGVTFAYTSWELGQARDQIAHMLRLIEPAAAQLAEGLDRAADGHALVTLTPQFPQGVDAAVAVSGFGISLRMVAAYAIEHNSMMMRFDALCGAVREAS